MAGLRVDLSTIDASTCSMSRGSPPAYLTVESRGSVQYGRLVALEGAGERSLL